MHTSTSQFDPRTLVGTPFNWGGCSPEEGFDCLTFLAYIFSKMGRKFPLPERVDRGAIDADVLDRYTNSFKRIHHPQPGCVVYFQNDRKPHIGYMVDARRVIHCALGRGVVVQRIALLTGAIEGYYEIIDADPT